MSRQRGIMKWLLIWPVVLCLTQAQAARNDWAEGTADKADGATRDYYNRAARLPWKIFMGDWWDAENRPQGDAAFASARVVDDDQAKYVEWDVSNLAHLWIEGKHQNQGFFLRTVGAAGTIVFWSREHKEADHRPRLIAVGTEGSVELEPQADTFLTKSTYRSQGTDDELRVSGGSDNVLLRFHLDRASRLGRITKATLRLYTTRQYGDADIGVFRCQQGHDLPLSPPVPGLAARYAHDQGIGEDDGVIFATGFESDHWADEWTQAGDLAVVGTIDADPSRKFEPLQGKALRVRIAKGSTGALNTTYKFAREIGYEPEKVYSRYYLRLADDWNQTLQGGKMPGISGTYGVAGWGGRKSHGHDGWSARGSFQMTIPEDNPLGGLNPIGTYCYHADMKGYYGDVWLWQNDYRGYLENNRWYCIEQYLELNTPGKTDGVLRAWVDGRLAFEKTDIRFRLVDKLKIEQIWMNVYHGGTKPSPYDQHLFIDNVVIAKEYIGPMVQKR
jgi:hypothetical protein